MSQLSMLTASAVTFEIGEKTYTLSPLTLRDQGEIDLAIERYPVERAKRLVKALGPDGPPDVVKQLWDEAMRPQMQPELLIQILSSAEIFATQLYLMLRHKHPDISMEEVRDLCRIENREELESLMDRVNGIPLEDNDNRGKEPAQATPDQTGPNSLPFSTNVAGGVTTK